MEGWRDGGKEGWRDGGMKGRGGRVAERERGRDGGKYKKTRRALLHQEGPVKGASLLARSVGSTEQRPWTFLLLKVITGGGIASIPGSILKTEQCERPRSTCSSESGLGR